jgi:tRNA(Ile2) C34 agmatinyltransferase TiaS
MRGILFLITYLFVVFIVYNFDKIVEKLLLKKDEWNKAKIKIKPIKKTKILVNKIKCNKCGEIIESVHRHDFKFCKCGSVAVDGGKDYLKRNFTVVSDYTEMSEIVEIKDEENNS